MRQGFPRAGTWSLHVPYLLGQAGTPRLSPRRSRVSCELGVVPEPRPACRYPPAGGAVTREEKQQRLLPLSCRILRGHPRRPLLVGQQEQTQSKGHNEATRWTTPASASSPTSPLRATHRPPHAPETFLTHKHQHPTCPSQLPSPRPLHQGKAPEAWTHP